MAARVYAITGAFGVLGSAVAKAAVAGGGRVALIDSHAAPRSPPPQGEVLVLGGVDLAHPAQAQMAMDAAAERFGGVDALLNIAGGFTWETHGEGSAETWRKMFTLNVETASNASRAAIPHLKR